MKRAREDLDQHSYEDIEQDRIEDKTKGSDSDSDKEEADPENSRRGKEEAELARSSSRHPESDLEIRHRGAHMRGHKLGFPP
jgi:hypothetical protein